MRHKNVCNLLQTTSSAVRYDDTAQAHFIQQYVYYILVCTKYSILYAGHNAAIPRRVRGLQMAEGVCSISLRGMCVYVYVGVFVYVHFAWCVARCVYLNWYRTALRGFAKAYKYIAKYMVYMVTLVRRIISINIYGGFIMHTSSWWVTGLQSARRAVSAIYEINSLLTTTKNTSAPHRLAARRFTSSYRECNPTQSVNTHTLTRKYALFIFA